MTLETTVDPQSPAQPRKMSLCEHKGFSNDPLNGSNIYYTPIVCPLFYCGQWEDKQHSSGV